MAGGSLFFCGGGVKLKSMKLKRHIATEQYDCPIQRLLTTVLQASLKDAAKGDHTMLGWVYDDPQPNHRYRISFDQVCVFLKVDSDLFIEGLESRPEAIINAKNYYTQTFQDRL